MTQSDNASEVNLNETSNGGVETKEESTTPNTDVDQVAAYRKLQSELDKERSEREKLAKDADYWRSQADTYLTQDQREQVLREQKAREAEERATKLEQELTQERSSKTREKLISEKYPYLKKEEFSDVVSAITGSEEEIELTLADLDKKFRAAAEDLAKEESAKESADPISSKGPRARGGYSSYEEIERLDPAAQKTILKKAWDQARDSWLGGK